MINKLGEGKFGPVSKLNIAFIYKVIIYKKKFKSFCINGEYVLDLQQKLIRKILKLYFDFFTSICITQ